MVVESSVACCYGCQLLVVVESSVVVVLSVVVDTCSGIFSGSDLQLLIVVSVVVVRL